MQRSGLWPALALAGALLVLLVALRPLLPVDETRYLSIAWDMRLSGDFVHMSRNGDLYAEKPPLLFWLVNAVWLVTGGSEFAARLVGPACALATVAITARLGRVLWPGQTGLPLRAVLILAGFPVFLTYGSLTMFDGLLAIAVTWGALTLWRIGSGAAGWRTWAVFGLTLALGTYAKGPVILVHLLPLLLTMGYWAPAAPARGVRLAGFLLALAVALAVVAAWLLPTLLTGPPEYRAALLWSRSAARVTGGVAHDRPVWFLIALLPAILFPWGWSWRLWRAVPAGWRGDCALRFAAIWAVSALILFSLISGKQAHYLIPAMPAAALIFARAAGRVAPARGGSAAALPLLGLAALSGAFAAGLIPATGDLADLTPHMAVGAAAVALGALAVAALRLPLLPGHAAAGAGLAVVLHGLIAATALYPTHDTHAIAARIAGSDGRVALYGITYNAEFNFAARLTAPVAVPKTPEALAAWAAAHPDGIVFGPVAAVPVPSAPEATERFHGETFGFWSASAVSVPAGAHGG